MTQIQKSGGSGESSALVLRPPGMPEIVVDLRNPDSIAGAAEDLVEAGQAAAADTLLSEAERLYDESVPVRVTLVMDTSGSMDGAGNIERVQRELPQVLRPVAGEIPVEVLVRWVGFGDTEMGDQITTRNWQPLEALTRMEWPRTSGGSARHESHIEALLVALGCWAGEGARNHLAPGSQLFPPQPPEGGGEIILVTNGELPRRPLEEGREALPEGWRLTVVAEAERSQFWSDLLREGDRFVSLSGDLGGLLKPLQNAVTSAVVEQAQKVVELIAATVQQKVAGLLTADVGGSTAIRV